MNNNVWIRVLYGCFDYLRISAVPSLIDRAQLTNLGKFEE